MSEPQWPQWWHAVSFDRPVSEPDKNFARDLLNEWAAARGLHVTWQDVDPAHAVVAEMMSIPLPVHIEEWDYKRRSGYAMGFYGEPHAPSRETRLKCEPTASRQILRGREEYYQS